jgi:hypothetical protein
VLGYERLEHAYSGAIACRSHGVITAHCWLPGCSAQDAVEGNPVTHTLRFREPPITSKPRMIVWSGRLLGPTLLDELGRGQNWTSALNWIHGPNRQANPFGALPVNRRLISTQALSIF